jgi:hypothetical protein
MLKRRRTPEFLQNACKYYVCFNFGFSGPGESVPLKW